MRNTTWAVVVGAVAMLTVAGCSSSPDTASPDSQTPSPAVSVAPAAPQSVDALVGRTFTVQGFQGAPDDVTFIGPVELTFNVDEWGASTPCNSHGGKGVTYTDTRIDITENLMTAVGCPGALDVQNAFIGTFFDGDPEWELSGDRLTLRSGESVIVATVLPSGATPIPLPTSDWTPQSSLFGAYVEGTLFADDECLRIRELGAGGVSTPVWPAGVVAYRSDGGTISVVNQDGKVVAKTGDEVRYVGGYSTAAPGSPCTGNGDTFLVQQELSPRP